MLRRSRAATALLALALLGTGIGGRAAGAAAAPAAPAWSEHGILIAPDGATNDNFGQVVMSSSGSTAIVGAYDKAFDARNEVGAAYVYVKQGDTWQFQAELTASDRAEGDGFGADVATTKNGSTVVIGAPFKNIAGKTNAGAAYVFTRSGTAWTQQAELIGAPSGRGNSFGSTVAINGVGTNIAVAAPLRSVSGHRRAGAVYVFKHAGSTWKQSALLTESGAQDNDYFGWALAAKETQVLISSPFHTNANGSSGVVYEFDDPSGTYTQQTALTASDGTVDDNFGWALDVSLATMVVGARNHVSAHGTGAVYVFTHSEKTGLWRSRAELTASDGVANDDFGETLAIDGTTVVVSNPFHAVGGNDAQGAVYAFTGAASTWAQQTELTASDGAAFSEFGSSVGVSGSTIMVGEPEHDVGAIAGAGLVDIFTQ